jgi:hypothetical protein
VLAATTASSWPLLLARVVLIALGTVLLVIGRRRGQRTDTTNLATWPD